MARGKPTPEQMAANLEMCRHEVERLRARIVTLEAALSELVEQIRELRASGPGPAPPTQTA